MKTMGIDTTGVPKTYFLYGLLIGVLFIAAGMFGIIDDIKFKLSADTTTAQIIRIEKKEVENSRNGSTTMRVATVSYFANNDLCRTELNYYSIFMKEGGELTIYYDPLNPTEIRGPYVSFLIILIMGAGIFLSLFCIKSYLKASKLS